MRPFALPLLTTIALVNLVASSHAATLFADNFDDVATGSNINGRTPQTSFNNSNWSATTATLFGDGAGGLSANINESRSASVDVGVGYMLNNPGVYELSLQIAHPAGSTVASWAGLGFTPNGTPSGNLFSNDGAPWLLYRANGQVTVFAGPANTNIVFNTATGAFAAGTSRSFSLKLDTTPGTEPWRLDVVIDGVTQDMNGAAAGTSYTFAAGANPTTSRFAQISTGFSSGSGSPATVDNFSLIGPIPEPASALFMLSGVALLASGRRRWSI